MTKNATLKMIKEVEQLGAVTRYLVACFTALGLIEKRVENGQEQVSFVNPETFSMLPVLKRGFVGRLRWLFLGK